MSSIDSVQWDDFVCCHNQLPNNMLQIVFLSQDRFSGNCCYDTQLLGACLHASESGGRSRPEAVRGMPERAVPPPGPQRQAVASSTRVDASSQDKPDGSSGGRAPGTGWAGLLTMEAGPLSRPSLRPTSGSIKPTTRRNWKRFAGACNEAAPLVSRNGRRKSRNVWA